MRNLRQAGFFFGPLFLVTLVTAQPNAPKRDLPLPTPQARAEYGLIAVADSRFTPETDAAVAQSLAAAGLQERLRAEVLARVSRIKGFTFAPASQEVAPTILEVRVERVALSKGTLLDDEPALVVYARARLVQPAYGRSIYDQKIEYRSPKRSMSQWKAFDSAAVRGDLDNGLRELAQKAADDIFLVYDGQLAQD